MRPKNHGPWSVAKNPGKDSSIPLCFLAGWRDSLQSFHEFTFLFGVKARVARVSMNFLSTHRWWRQEYYGRIAYCIPILAFASCIYDVSTRQTPEMVQQAQWASWLIYHGILFLVGKPSILTYSLHILMSQSWPCWRRVALVPWEGHRISDMRQQVADMFVSENRLPPNLIRTDSIIIFPYFPIFSRLNYSNGHNMAIILGVSPRISGLKSAGPTPWHARAPRGTQGHPGPKTWPFWHWETWWSPDDHRMDFGLQPLPDKTSKIRVLVGCKPVPNHWRSISEAPTATTTSKLWRNLAGKLLNEPGKRSRECVVVRVEHEDEITNASAVLLETLPSSDGGWLMLMGKWGNPSVWPTSILWNTYLNHFRFEMGLLSLVILLSHGPTCTRTQGETDAKKEIHAVSVSHRTIPSTWECIRMSK